LNLGGATLSLGGATLNLRAATLKIGGASLNLGGAPLNLRGTARNLGRYDLAPFCKEVESWRYDPASRRCGFELSVTVVTKQKSTAIILVMKATKINAPYIPECIKKSLPKISYDKHKDKHYSTLQI
jgi:hypothetical protein